MPTPVRIAAEKARSLVLLFVTVWSLIGANVAVASEIATLPPMQFRKADLVIIEKSARTLQLVSKGEVFRSYRVALGFTPTGDKLLEGDGRTPEGFYFIDRRNPNSSFHLSLGISYPNIFDVDHASSLGVSAGGDIMIHGLPNGARASDVGHPFRDWTAGCIAVSNQEIEEIWYLVDDGTPVSIKP